MKTGSLALPLALLIVLLAACGGVTAPAPDATPVAAASPTPSQATPDATKLPGSLPGNNAVLSWSRQGGIAGFCDEVVVLADGSYTVSSCVGKYPTQSGQLTSNEYAQLAGWVQQFASFESKPDKAHQVVPDELIFRMSFQGSGTQTASPDEMAAISNFAQDLVKPSTPVSDGGYPDAAFKARDFLAQELGLASDEIRIVNVEAVDWPDGCMDVIVMGQMCTMVVTPGYRVTLQAQGRLYELHTNTTGDSIRRAPGSKPAPPGGV